MKKLLYLPLLLVAFTANAQQGVIFKMKYLPGRNYNATTNMTMKVNLTMSGDNNLAASINPGGGPLDIDMTMSMDGTIKTGAKGADKTFPIAIGYKMGQMNMTMNGKKIDIPIPTLTSNTTAIYGHIDESGKLKADSIGGAAVKDTSEKSIAAMMNAIQNAVKFPDRPLKVGDTFEQEMPFSLPVAGTGLSMNAKVTYKLVSINAGNAYFDVNQTMDIKIPVKDDFMTISGTGSGKMVYSIKDSFPTEFKSDMTLTAKGKVTSLAIDGTAQFGMEYKYTIN